MAISDWSTTASSNGNSDANINWQEGQAPSTVNDSARSMMTRLKHWWNQLGANTTQGGASNAYTITSGESLSAYANGMRFLWQPNADSTGAVTLNVDSIGAKKVYLPDGTQAGSGDLDADSMYDVVYDTALDTAAGGWKIVGFPDANLASGPYLTVANNLSDLNSASTARSNLGLVIGTNVQAYDAQLADVAGLTPTDGGFIVGNGTNFVVETGTTAQTSLGYTAADVLSKLLTVDGAGSTLDADTLDGVEGSGFVNVSSTQTITGDKTFSGAGPIFTSLTPPRVSAVTAQMLWEETDQGSNEKVWSWTASGGVFSLRTLTDAYSTGELVLTVSRSGTTALTVTVNADFVAETIAAQVDASSETSGTLTSASANKQITAAGGITIPASVFAAGDMIVIDGGGTARTITRGSGLTMYIAGTNSATGTLTANGLMGVRFRSATVCILTGDVS